MAELRWRRQLQPQLIGDDGAQRSGRAFAQDAAAIDDCEAVDDAFGLGEVVGDQEHGGAAVAEFADGLPEQAAADGVDIVGGFIEHEHAGAADDGGGEPGEAPHAAGGFVHRGVTERFEVQARDHVIRAPGGLQRGTRRGDGRREPMNSSMCRDWRSNWPWGRKPMRRWV